MLRAASSSELLSLNRAIWHRVKNLVFNWLLDPMPLLHRKILMSRWVPSEQFGAGEICAELILVSCQCNAEDLIWLQAERASFLCPSRKVNVFSSVLTLQATWASRFGSSGFLHPSYTLWIAWSSCPSSPRMKNFVVMSGLQPSSPEPEAADLITRLSLCTVSCLFH